VCQNEFGDDGFDVSKGINGPSDVMDVGIFKAADHLNDRVNLADVREEFVSKTFALGCAFDQAGDVHKFYGRGDNDGSFGDFGERLEPRVRHRDNADVRINGAEGIIGGFGLTGAGDRVEKGGFADVGETDDSGSEHVI